MNDKLFKARNDIIFKASDRIKKCPFCGSTANIWLSESRLSVYVECDNIDCMARSGSGINIMEVIDKWNKRAFDVIEETSNEEKDNNDIGRGVLHERRKDTNSKNGEFNKA